MTLLASAGGWFFISGRVNGQPEDVARTLRVASEQVTSASHQVPDSGQLMAGSASGQAASLEETNASLREIHSATRAGVELANEVGGFLAEIAATAEETASASFELSKQTRDVFQAAHCLNQIISVGTDGACREEYSSGFEPRKTNRPQARPGKRHPSRPAPDQAHGVFSLGEAETMEI